MDEPTRIRLEVKVHPKDYELMIKLRPEDLGDLLSDGYHYWIASLRKQPRRSWWQRLFRS
jgi:hypothetical protein